MDKEKAKEYLFDDNESRKIYISKDLQKLMDMSSCELSFIYAVVETESGDTLMDMDWSYADEPIIMHRFVHKDYFIKFNKDKEVIIL